MYTTKQVRNNPIKKDENPTGLKLSQVVMYIMRFIKSTLKLTFLLFNANEYKFINECIILK